MTSREAIPELTPLTGPVRRRPFVVCDIESKDEDTQVAGFTRPFLMGVYAPMTEEETQKRSCRAGTPAEGDSSESDLKQSPSAGPPARREGIRSLRLPDGFHAFFDTNPSAPWKERFWRPGGSVDRAMRFMLHKRFLGHHIYAHNAGRFDYLFILPWLMNVGKKLGYRFSVIPVSSSIQVLDVWRGRRRRTWRFIDSVRLIPTSLDKAAKAFGLAGKLAHDLNIPEHDQDRWSDYNGVDCVELYRVLEKFHSYVEDTLKGEVGITAPATAVRIFRRNYLKRAYPRHVETHAFVRAGYVGGRVEPFESEAWNLRYYDVNSSYPASMLEDMPCGIATEWDGEPPERFRSRAPYAGAGGPADGDCFRSASGNSCPPQVSSPGSRASGSDPSPSHVGFCEVDIFVPPMHIPPLPVKHDGKLIFPTGKLRGIWDWSEIALAVEEGCRVERWGKSVWYESFPIFREYVIELYKYRDKSRADYDRGLDEVVKIMLNGTYGKFGMKTLRKKLYLHDDPFLPDGSEPVTPDPESPVWTHSEECDAAYIMPQISAHVTTLSRIRLYRQFKNGSCGVCWPARCSCGANHLVAYGDTDSVLCTKEIPTGTELGAMKDEIPEHSGKLRGRFLGPKTYILSIDDDPERFVWEGNEFEKVKAKGLEHRTRSVVEMLERGETIYQRRLEKVGTLARAGFSRGPEERIVPRRILQTVGKREVLEDGTTRPHALDMWN